MERLNAALRNALQNPEIVARFTELGTAPVPLEDVTPDSLETKYKSEIEFWRPLIEAAGGHAQ
jgi:tripartite-type tricarboxylate transporter receptor subunit TctC